MGRNRKVGLDWWPRDIGLYRDPKLRAARQKFGVLGPYVYECLLDIAYGDKGLLHRLQRRGPRGHAVAAPRVHRRTGKRDDRNTGRGSRSAGGKRAVPAALYERGFLTSKRIQMGYFIATVTRNAVPINFDIWHSHRAGNAGEESEWQVFCAACIYFPHGKCDFIVRKNAILLYRKIPQSREEQRTEEQRTVEDSRAEQTREEKAVTADSGLTTELEEKLNCKFDHNFCLELRRLQNKGMQREVFLDTARQTAENAPRNPAGYFRTLLQNCERDGILTAADMQKRAKPAPSQPAIGPSSEQLSAFNQEWYERVKRYTKGKRRCRHNPFQPRPCLL